MSVAADERARTPGASMTFALPASTLALLRADVRAGRSCFITFDQPDCAAWLDILGPAGMDGDPDLRAAVPTVRLWGAGARAPLAEAAANRAFPVELDRVAQRARSLVGAEWPLLVTVLATIREATEGMRFRTPAFGDRITSRGRTNATAWMSALSLSDMQSAILKAVA